jgi:hypothetical protein
MAIFHKSTDKQREFTALRPGLCAPWYKRLTTSFPALRLANG